jgi:ubiquinone/menaquinone biosynthesis C-methylase UbiE
MGFSESDLDRDGIKLHADVYRWAAKQFEPGRVIDVGSELGVGVTLMQAENPKLTFIGCDIDQQILRHAGQFFGYEEQDRIQADAARLPLPGESLSGACLINILHLVQNPEGLLDEAHRVLKPCGKVVIFVELSKLPTRWKDVDLSRKIDKLLDLQFQAASTRKFLDQEWARIEEGSPSDRDFFLRIGIKP